MTSAADRNPSIFVHERGNQSLDGIFRLIEMAGQPRPADEVLAAMCADVAAIAGADVVSIYVHEEDAAGDVFTMRGNVGFPAEAVGRVRLRVGEGIIGFVADRLRPVSVALAERDEHFKYIPGLGEERFPALLAVPVLRGDRAAGVLVLQRGPLRTFASEEVVLATALAAVVSHALERAAARERERQTDRGVARLQGTCLAGGAAMGRAEIFPTLAALARAVDPALPGRVPADVAIKRVESDLRRAAQKLGGVAPHEIAALFVILDDQRFRKQLTIAADAASPRNALTTLARDYARAAFQTAPGDDATAEVMAQRAAEIEDLCVLVHAATMDRPLIRAGAIVVAEKLRGFFALYAIARGASAFVIDGELGRESVSTAMVRAATLPLLSAVTGVFAWVRPDDLLVIDADAGSVRVNPESTTVARFRTTRT